LSEKLSAWSEGHQSVDDIMHGLRGSDEDVVMDHVVKRGVVMVTDCTYCGRQWKGVMTWQEICLHYLHKPVEGTAKTRQGVVSLLPCNGCQKTFRTITDWDEIRRYVDVGIRYGLVNPRIRQAAPQGL
jgi:hypothetical protein